MSSPLFQEYVELKDQISKLEERREELMYQLINEIEYDGGKNYAETKFGKFVIVPKTTYQYSEKVDKLKDILYTLKKREEFEGIAQIKSASRYIRVERQK